jgi:Polyglycine hydrolase-like, structural repeat
MVDFVAWHGKSLLEHTILRDTAANEGYRFLSLSVYGSTAQPFYAAVMIRRPIIVAQRG